MASVKPGVTGDRCLTCNGSGHGLADAGGFMVEVDCEDCNGTGLVNSPDACSVCKGKGTEVAKVTDSLGIEVDCERCKGTGLEPLVEAKS